MDEREKRNRLNHCCEQHHKIPIKKCRPRSCKEDVGEFIHSAANIENALANAINAQSYMIKHGNLSKKELCYFTNKLERTLKLAIKKEIVLDFLIQDIGDVCEHCMKHHSNCCCNHRPF